MFKEKPNLTQEELLWKIYESTEKTRKYLLWARVLSFLKLIIIVVPIVLAIIYLPAYINKIAEPYRELLQTTQSGQDSLKNLNLQELINQYK